MATAFAERSRFDCGNAFAGAEDVNDNTTADRANLQPKAPVEVINSSGRAAVLNAYGTKMSRKLCVADTALRARTYSVFSRTRNECTHFG